jgi:predicted anti-sigma-YlaC factor YlaD
VCERAMQLLSLSLDGEISKVEQAELGRHLQSCSPCVRLSAELADLTEALRQAPLDVPERELVLPAPPRRARLVRRGGLVVSVAAGAAALAAVLVLGTSTEIVYPDSSVLAFAEPRDQIRFAYTRVTEIEPFRTETIEKTVPTFSRRALR